MNKFTLSILAVAAMAMTACGGASSSKDAAAENTDTVATEQVEATPAAAVDAVVELTEDIEITPSEDGRPVIMDFNATWCGPCKQFAPVFHKVAGEYASKARFMSIDVDNCPAAANQFKVQSIPQITILKADGTTESVIGNMSEAEFKAFIDKNL